MSFAWHANRDGNSSDEDNIVLLPYTDEPATTSYSLNNQEEEESVCIQRRSRRVSLSFRERMLQKAKDERKYKLSIVSTLLIAICLILMVNIGLGINHCSTDSEETKSLPTKSVCIDKSTGQKFPWQHYRLPLDVVPDSYHIFLHPNLTLQKYTGAVTINVTVNKSTDRIILHSRGHQFSLVEIHSVLFPKVVHKASILKCDLYETVSLSFGVKLQQGKQYQMVINFKGNLTYSLGGFYLSKYKKSDGSEKVIATTQFEAVSARAAFPCFDEPTFKATFSLCLVREAGMFTLFNMPLSSTVLRQDGLFMDIFPPSLKMSSYLVAFIVSDFAHISNTTNRGLKTSVYCRPDKIEDAKFALRFAIKALEGYEQRFGIAFPLPKMDLVAIPDFAAGAMENWGLITYRETALLYNPVTSSISNQNWVAIVIAHELSHQWFGDLVTMKWWNDLWLNEGFASYMEFDEVNRAEPSWKIMSKFVTSHVLVAMAVDSSRYTHPLSQLVTNSHEIREMFDQISYDKGASMISMLVSYIHEKFFLGVNAYLKKHAYGNADNHDLLLAISQQAGKNSNILKMMQTWTTQPGFPLVKVSVKGSKIFVEQLRFLYPLKETTRLPSSTVWQIPLTYVTDEAPTTPQTHFLSQQTDSVAVGNFKWIKFNHNFAGFYRVSYDSSLWGMLIRQMQTDHTVFTPEDRISIMSDAFTMARTGSLEYSSLFQLLRYFLSEASYSPIVATLRELSYIRAMLEYNLATTAKTHLDSFVAGLLTPLYSKLAWRERTDLTRMQLELQSEVVSASCSFNYQPCIDAAYAKFLDWKINATHLQPDYMLIILRTAVLHGHPSDWDYLWSAYLNTTDPIMKSKMLTSLAYTTDVNRIQFLQEEILKGKDIRSQSISILNTISGNVAGSILVWRFVRHNWDQLIKIHPIGEFSMRRVVKYCIASIVNEEDLTNAENFFALKKVNTLKSIKLDIEASRINIYWSQVHLPSVKAWLKRKYAKASSG